MFSSNYMFIYYSLEIKIILDLILKLEVLFLLFQYM